ncbi:hypothetical protein AnigIFM63309_011368 [Aspergillus niger]|nr:hypothetical protein AnigIFM63309_011368 [Aspergillus niger]
MHSAYYQTLLGEGPAYLWSFTPWPDDRIAHQKTLWAITYPSYIAATLFVAVYGLRWGRGDDTSGQYRGVLCNELPSDARQKGSQTGLRRACPVTRVGMVYAFLALIGADSPAPGKNEEENDMPSPASFLG